MLNIFFSSIFHCLEMQKRLWCWHWRAHRLFSAAPSTLADCHGNNGAIVQCLDVVDRCCTHSAAGISQPNGRQTWRNRSNLLLLLLLLATATAVVVVENQYVGPHHRFPLFIRYVIIIIMTSLCLLHCTALHCAPKIGSSSSSCDKSSLSE